MFQLAQARLAVRAIDILHHIEERFSLNTRAVEADDVRVVELAEQVGFALEALAGDWVAGEVGSEHLERTYLVGGVGRVGVIDAAHGATTQLAVDDPAAQLRSDHEGSPVAISISHRRGASIT